MSRLLPPSRASATSVRRAGLLLGAMLTCVFGAGASFGQGPSAPPYRIQWPPGWEITHLSAPKTAGGKQFPGERVRAVVAESRAEGATEVAAIELTVIPRVDSGRASLAYEFEVALRGIQVGYAQKKFDVDLGSLQVSTLGGLKSMATEISVVEPSAHLRQWIGMAMSPTHIYSLSYSADEANYARYRPAFEDLKRELVLQ